MSAAAGIWLDQLVDIHDTPGIVLHEDPGTITGPEPHRRGFAFARARQAATLALREAHH